MKKPLLPLLYFLVLSSCFNIEKREQKQDYDSSVYQFINTVFKTTKKIDDDRDLFYLNPNINLSESYENINKILLDSLLRKAYKKNRFHQVNIPESVINIENWASVKTDFPSEKLDSSKITLSNVRLTKNREDIPEYSFLYTIKGILILDEYVVISLSPGEGFESMTLFKKEGNKFVQVVNDTYPRTGLE